MAGQDTGSPWTKETLTEKMVQYIRKKFPNLQTDTLFIPDQVFHKPKYMRLEERSTASNPVIRQDQSRIDVFNSDKTENDVMQCLRHVTRSSPPQPMMVLSTYYSGNFLNEEVDSQDKESSPSVSANAKKDKTKVRDVLFPETSDQTQAEFDVLILSPKFGFVIIEIKAIGAFKGLEEEGTVSGGLLLKLKEKVEAILSQMENAEEVLRNIATGVTQRTIPITKCVALPFLPSSSLRDMVDQYPDTAERLRAAFNVSTVNEALERCLCADVVAYLQQCEGEDEGNPRKTASENDDPLVTWWHHVTEAKRGDTAEGGSKEFELSSDEYEKIVAMFCGPFSKMTIDRGNVSRGQRKRNVPVPFTEQVRTPADCVHLTGIRYGRSILLPDQSEVLDSQEQFVFLAGPPGCGKTLLLGLKAVEWVTAGDHVVVVAAEGTGWGSLVSKTLFAQIQKAITPPETPPPKQTSSTTTSKKSKKRKAKPSTDPSSATTTQGQNPSSTDISTGAVKDLTQNVTCLIFSKSTDPAVFMQDLLQQSEDVSRLRVIVDECPIKVNDTRLYSQLDGVHRRLGTAKGKLQTSLKTVQKAEESRKNIQDHLSNIKLRLVNLQPANKRPLITQSSMWTERMDKIATICQEIEDLLHSSTTADPLPAVSATPADAAEEELGKGNEAEKDGLKNVNEAEAQAQEASGLLFNVETGMDFFVIDDVLVTMATEQKSKGVRVWASGIYPSYHPKGFEQKRLRCSLRCPPTVQKVLDDVEKDISDGPGFFYQCQSLPENRFVLPTPGPEVKLLDHGSHMTQTKEIKEISDCASCGMALADYLQECIDQSEGLGWHDIIITGSFDISGFDSQFSRTLRERGIILQYGEDATAGAPAPPPCPGKVFVIGGSPLQGLESKIVVFLPDIKRIPTTTADPKQFREGLPDWLKNLGRWNRCHLWFVASRCLSQLVVFKV